MKKYLAPAIAFVIVTFLLVVFAYYYTTTVLRTSKTSPSPSSTPTQFVESQVEVDLSFSPAEDGTVMVNLGKKGESVVISAISLRVLYPESEGASLKPKISINSDLISQGWLFPVAKMLDLAAVNLSPEGFELSSEIELAKINFPGLTSGDSVKLSFDPTETRVISKAGKEFKVIMGEGVYTSRQ